MLRTVVVEDYSSVARDWKRISVKKVMKTRARDQTAFSPHFHSGDSKQNTTPGSERDRHIEGTKKSAKVSVFTEKEKVLEKEHTPNERNSNLALGGSTLLGWPRCPFCNVVSRSLVDRGKGGSCGGVAPARATCAT